MPSPSGVRQERGWLRGRASVRVPRNGFSPHWTDNPGPSPRATPDHGPGVVAESTPGQPPRDPGTVYEATREGAEWSIEPGIIGRVNPGDEWPRGPGWSGPSNPAERASPCRSPGFSPRDRMSAKVDPLRGPMAPFRRHFENWIGSQSREWHCQSTAIDWHLPLEGLLHNRALWGHTGSTSPSQEGQFYVKWGGSRLGLARLGLARLVHPPSYNRPCHSLRSPLSSPQAPLAHTRA